MSCDCVCFLEGDVMCCRIQAALRVEGVLDYDCDLAGVLQRLRDGQEG